MQNESSSTWPSTAAGSSDEFANFLEFNDLDLDFPAFDNQVQAQQSQSQDVSDQSGMKQNYDAAAYFEHMRQAALQKNGTIGSMSGRMTGMQGRPSSHPAQHGYQQPMHYQRGIPPTPSSTDLHGGHPQLMVDSQQASMYEARMRKQQEQMAFTPLGTPAVTPMDTNFQMRDFAVPGEYFSPLASPAMHAQNQQAEGALYYPFQVSDVSETTSPVDVSFDSSLKPNVARRQTKKRSPGSVSKPNPRTVKQSPAMKAQRKKQSSTTIPAKEVNDVISNSRPSTASGSQSLGLPPTNMSSESPEPLLDMMPPPAIPSANRSPYIPPHPQSAPVRAQNPVTPTSLLKMQNAAPMQDLSLGEAALDTEDVAMTDAPTPTMSALQSSVFTPSSAMSPPSTAATPRMKGKADFKAPNPKGKKRNSSSHASPALRPKISPSIKPLLPDGMLNAETSALLLASKSNYQNILDGTHLPGVTYPEALSENLTSKRTSHKIAEQGRRNRINTALQEIAALLPQGASPSGDSSAATQSTSKASTVEQAIDYIKSLQAEIKDTKDRLIATETRLKEIESAQGSVRSTSAETPGDHSDPGDSATKDSETS